MTRVPANRYAIFCLIASGGFFFDLWSKNAVFARLGWLEPARFHFQNFGSSYLLEFVATEWIMCAYNPPWPDERGPDAEEENREYGQGIDYDEAGTLEVALDIEDGRGTWNCPESRPELW